MAIDRTMTTDTTADGREIVSEINTVMTETAADGTETVAEITTTADPDDPTQIEGHILLTVTAPDGTETVTEVVTKEDGTFIVEDNESLIEEVIEATFGVEIGDVASNTAISNEGSFDNAEFEIVESSSEYENASPDFAVSGEMFAPTVMPADAVATPFMNESVDSSFGIADPSYSSTPFSAEPMDSPFNATPDYSATGTTDNAEADAEALAQQVHADAAKEAQASADEFIAAGDYEAAAQAREVAENESWEASDSSMLGAYDAQDLTVAAEKQEEAEYYNEQQAAFAQAGDYEAAREASGNAAYATYEADSTAGGDDHTGQADAEYQKMDMAAWEQDIADDKMDNAAAYAAEGDFETAAIYAESAVDAQESADNFGDLGEHGGDMAVYDPSSVVDTGGTYDSSAIAVDTGFDSSVDMSTNTGYDSATDDV